MRAHWQEEPLGSEGLGDFTHILMLLPPVWCLTLTSVTEWEVLFNGETSSRYVQGVDLQVQSS